MQAEENMPWKALSGNRIIGNCPLKQSPSPFSFWYNPFTMHKFSNVKPLLIAASNSMSSHGDVVSVVDSMRTLHAPARGMQVLCTLKKRKYSRPPTAWNRTHI
jgi:hypothetical protein